MNLRRRALSLAAIAALSLALVPDAGAGRGNRRDARQAAAAADILVGRDGIAREKDTGQPHARPAAAGQGHELRRISSVTRAGLVPRHHRTARSAT